MILRILLLALLLFAGLRFVYRLVLTLHRMTGRGQPKKDRWRPRKGIDNGDVVDAEFEDVDGG